MLHDSEIHTAKARDVDGSAALKHAISKCRLVPVIQRSKLSLARKKNSDSSFHPNNV